MAAEDFNIDNNQKFGPADVSIFQYTYKNSDGNFHLDGKKGQALYRWHDGKFYDDHLAIQRYAMFENGGDEGMIYKVPSENFYLFFGAIKNQSTDPNIGEYYTLYYSFDGNVFKRWLTQGGTDRFSLQQVVPDLPDPKGTVTVGTGTGTGGTGPGSGGTGSGTSTGGSKPNAVRTLVDQWLPADDDFNFELPIGKLVARYRLLVTSEHASLNGYWYVRKSGHKIAQDDHSDFVNLDLSNGSGTIASDFIFAGAYKLGESLSVNPKKVNIKIYLKGPGVDQNFIDQSFDI